MKYAIGDRVWVLDPELCNIEFEIFCYDTGMYRLMDKVNRVSIDVEEDEIVKSV